MNDLQTSTLLVKNEFTPVSGKNKRTVLNRHTLSVRFPDGTVICENSAIDTLIKTIEKIGFEKVMSLGLKVSGEPLVDTKPQQLNRKHGEKGYKQYKNYFIISNFNNDGKANRLKDISDRLGLNLTITDDISC